MWVVYIITQRHTGICISVNGQHELEQLYTGVGVGSKITIYSFMLNQEKTLQDKTKVVTSPSWIIVSLLRSIEVASLCSFCQLLQLFLMSLPFLFLQDVESLVLLNYRCQCLQSRGTQPRVINTAGLSQGALIMIYVDKPQTSRIHINLPSFSET